ncbi:MAG TPA: Asp-tRNA(Asn)/Glu-tRNA(Gln) amidotransferase subunit GatC [Verrucomicrobiota bacterium]|nr:Asp-tRNA(Asn)/Glu-tRNA(Gln) amidotransferase subunit GatC [Verrucomicrobiota bacterium]HNU49735.1 Asp-tRNA(Asn)/Glu-tRNA(Gln) amidotransferase subunit GatC [Verrucomicrobiota bacterium]
MPSPHLDVRDVARLARLALTPDEEATLGSQLDDILAYMRELEKVDVAGVEATAHPVPLANVVRPDIVQPSLDPREALQNAPAHNDHLFVVPRIVE